MGSHVVRRLVFDVDIVSQSMAEAAQDRLSRFSQTALKPLLDRLLQESRALKGLLSPVSSDVRVGLDRLELDLGDLTLDQLERELEARIPGALEQALQQALNRPDGASSAPETVPGRDHPGFHQLAHFLEHGVLHWTTSPDRTPSELLKACLDQDREGLRALLVQIGRSSRVQARLARQFDAVTRDHVLALLTSGHTDTAQALVKGLVELQRHWPDSGVDRGIAGDASTLGVRQLAWEGVLAGLLSGPVAVSTRATLTRSVVVRLADALGAEERELAEVLLRRANLRPAASGLARGLRELVETQVGDSTNPRVSPRLSGPSSGRGSGRGQAVAEPVPMESGVQVGPDAVSPMPDGPRAETSRPGPIAELLHLLRTGAPPSFGGSLARQPMDVFIGGLLDADPETFLDTLQTLAHRPDQLARLLRYLPRASLERLIHVRDTESGGFVITQLLAIERAAEDGRLPASAPGVAWQVALGTMFESGRGKETPNALVADLLYREARRLGLREGMLLEILRDAVAHAVEPRFRPLSEFIDQRLQAIEGESNDGPLATADTDPSGRTPGGALGSGVTDVEPLPDGTKTLGEFLRFGIPLVSGYDADGTGALDRALSDAMQHHAEALRHLLAEVIREPLMLQRLVINAPQARLADLASWLSRTPVDDLLSHLNDLGRAFTTDPGDGTDADGGPLSRPSVNHADRPGARPQARSQVHLGDRPGVQPVDRRHSVDPEDASAEQRIAFEIEPGAATSPPATSTSLRPEKTSGPEAAGDSMATGAAPGKEAGSVPQREAATNPAAAAHYQSTQTISDGQQLGSVSPGAEPDVRGSLEHAAGRDVPHPAATPTGHPNMADAEAPAMSAPWSAAAYQALFSSLDAIDPERVDTSELRRVLLRTIAGQPGWDANLVLRHLRARRAKLPPSASTARSELLDRLIREAEAELPPATRSRSPESSWPYRRDAHEALAADPCYLDNAGQVLLWPFLQRFFGTLNLLDGRAFRDFESACHGACLIELMVRGDAGAREHRMPLNKVLCGLDTGHPLADPEPPSDAEQDLCESLLHGVTQNWTPLRNTSIDGLREAFLQRDGSLERRDSGWSLCVEKKPYDMLLDRLPWGLSTIRLPWMKEVLSVTWR